MAQDSLYALYAALGRRLEAGSAVWGTQVYADQAPSEIHRPYLVFSISTGGRAWRTRTADADYNVDVVCVADDAETALSGSAKITELLADSGSQDYGANKDLLAGGSEWTILTVSEGEKIAVIEDAVSGSEQIYHYGAQYSIKMERIT